MIGTRARWVVLLGVGLAGCVGPHVLRGDRPAPVRVQVTNHNRRDAAIYWVASGQRVRLGTTVSNEISSFVVPGTRRSGLLDIRLSAEIIGSDHGYLTPRISVGPGETIELNLEDLLVTSSFSVRQAGRPAVKPR
jgi:hypothetical protein